MSEVLIELFSPLTNQVQVVVPYLHQVLTVYLSYSSHHVCLRM